MLWNVYNFFVTYANIDNWSPVVGQKSKGNLSILDKWILSRLNNSIKTATDHLLKFNPQPAAISIESFLNDLSLWYIRRSRKRVGPDIETKEDKNAFYSTAYTVLVTLSKLLAPVMPFIPDDIYTNLTGEETVHLADWPEIEASVIDKKLEEAMKQLRRVVELGLSQRKENNIKVRQPLSELRINNLDSKIEEELLQLVKDELNVKEIVQKEGKGELSVKLNTEITPELKSEGEMREIVRQIQEERKKHETTLSEKVDVVLSSWPADFEAEIKKRALVRNLVKGDKFEIRKI